MHEEVYRQKKQIVYWFNAIAKLYVPVIALLALFTLLSSKTGIPLGIFTKDPAVVADANGLAGANFKATLNPLVGAISNIGILIWTVAATVCFLSFSLLKKFKTIARRSTKLSAFLLASGCLTSVLLLDDLFLFHEAIAPGILKIPQTAVYICLAAMTLLWIGKFRKTIVKTEYTFLLLAFVFFGLSITVDRIIDSYYAASLSKDTLDAIEDGLKLFGIISWLRYFMAVFFQVIDRIADDNNSSNSSLL